MNLPNKLSLLRTLCIPILVLLMYLNTHFCHIAAVLVFCLACLTDYFDGQIARKKNLITDFGKFIDPLADKLLVLSVLIMLIHQQMIMAWAVILILARELAVDGLRLIAVTKGKVIPAAWPGKVKTFSQMILILYLMIFQIPVQNHWVGIVLTAWTLLITLYSGFHYFSANRGLIGD